MGKIDIRLNAIVGAGVQYGAEALKEKFIENGFSVVSEVLTPQSGANSGISTIVYSKSGMPFDLQVVTEVNTYLTTTSRYTLSFILNGNPIGNMPSKFFRNSTYDTSAQFAIFIAYNTDYVMVNTLAYTENPLTAIPSYLYGLFAPNTISFTDYPYLSTNNVITFSNATLYKSDGTSLNTTSNSYYTANTNSTFVHPEDKIVLIPLYLAYSGTGTKVVDAEIPNGYVSLCDFPSDCPNEFKLDGQDYVRNGRTVFKA